MTAPTSDSDGASTPRLQAPGAGLPFLERLFLKFVVLRKETKRNTWESNMARFEREGRKILALLEGLDDAALGKRVLVKRVPGLEDSSRYWSVAMTLEHIMVVGSQMSFVVGELSHGRTPTVKADVVSVKPKGMQAPSQVVSSFQDFLQSTIPNLKKATGEQTSSSTFAHPWFGPITAKQWLWLLGSHQGLHRKQIEAIVAGL